MPAAEPQGEAKKSYRLLTIEGAPAQELRDKTHDRRTEDRCTSRGGPARLAWQAGVFMEKRGVPSGDATHLAYHLAGGPWHSHCGWAGVHTASGTDRRGGKLARHGTLDIFRELLQ